MKILIADDQEANRTLLMEMLKSLGECILAENGREAVEFFELAQLDGEPFNLVLMDIMMPLLDGKNAVKMMRELEKDHLIPPREEAVIIMVTALDSARDVIQSFYQCGCTDYLAKPFLRNQLMEKLDQYRLVSF